MSSRFCTLLLTTTALVPLGLAPAIANPLGAQVVGGSASVQGQGTANVTVTQSTDKAIINWNTFNIGSNEKTQFVQPNSSSIALNRVTGGLGPSQIFGTLSANGRIFVVNPDGILVGPGAKIDTAGFLATTHDIANADFMAGRYNFSIPGRPDASIVNQGTITAQNGGFAALVAPGVRNTGTITARLGTVTLASGNGFSLDFYGDRLITLGVSDSIAAQVKDVATGQRLSALVSNEGKLKANGGTVQLTAVSARKIVDSVINNRGVIEANSIGRHNGMIVLGAATGKTKLAGTPTQTVTVSGKLSAAGRRNSQTGGTVQVTGEAVALAGATIDASGRAGGGTVLIGGDTGGGNSNPAISGLAKAQLQPWAVPNATTVSVDAASTINASAKDAGDGGKVVVWADESTTFNGAISAGGGTQSGNGGFVETSGHQTLSFNGAVDTSAPYGESGTLLLDPQDTTIASSGSWIVTPTALSNALASGDVIVTNASGSGNGDIVVAENVSWSSANSLTLNAYRNIAVNAAISNMGGAAITLRADDTGTGTGTVSFGSAGQLSTSGAVSILYNPSVNPGGSLLNSISYVSPVESFAGKVTGGASLTAYMLVNSVYDLQNIQNNLTAAYALGRDIDASGSASWNGGAGFVPIGNFSNFQASAFRGAFDGQGHTIDRLKIGQTCNLPSNLSCLSGLFGYSFPGRISNVGLTNVAIAINKDTLGLTLFGVGGLVGWNRGTIEKSYVSGSINVTGSTNNNDTTVGGLVGRNDGFISLSYSNASVSSEPVSSDVGGLVGVNGSGSIDQSYSAGTVSGGAFAAGLVSVDGSNNGISRSYWDTQASLQSTSAAGIGLTTSQLKSALPSGFDSSIWGISASVNGGYPHLLWQVAGTSPSNATTLTGSSPIIAITVTADSVSKLYGAVDPILTYQITSGALSGSDTFSGALTRTAGENVGIYSINLGSLALPPTYTLTYVGGNLTITPATLTYTANAANRTYGSSNPSLSGTVSGFVNGDTLASATRGAAAFNTTAATSSNVGTYAITGSGLTANNGNYAFTQAAGNATALTITPAPLTISADDKSRQTGFANPTFTASYSGFVSGDNSSVVSGLALSTPATTNSPAGTYAITPSGASASNYTISYVNGVLTLTSAPTPTTIPSVPSDSSPSFGQLFGQTNAFAAPFNWQVAQSTPPVIPTSYTTASVASTRSNTPGSIPSGIKHPPQWIINDVKNAYGSSLENIKIIAQDAQYALLANAAYANGTVAPAGWSVVGGEQTVTGMSATVFKNAKTKEVVVSFRGTVGPANGPDWITDYQLVAGINVNNLPAMQSARSFAKSIQQNYGNVTFTGHSLGGAMAQYAAVELGGQAIAFDPAPLAASLKAALEQKASSGGSLTVTGMKLPDYPNITNFRGPRDPVTRLTGTGDIGKPAIVVKNISEDPRKLIFFPELTKDRVVYNHDMGDFVLAMRVVQLVAPSILSIGSGR